MIVSVAVAVLRLLSLICVVDALLSWVQPDASSFPRSLTRAVTEPLYAPIHAILSPARTGGLDFSPIIAIMLLNWIARTLSAGAGL